MKPRLPSILSFCIVARPALSYAEVLPSDVAVFEDPDGSLSDMMTQAMPNVWLQKDASGGVAQDGAPADRAEAVLCTPRKRLCHPFQAAVVLCNDAGDGWSLVEDCGANGLVCEEGACVAEPSPTSTGGGCSSRSETGASALVVAIGLLGLLAALASNRSSAANRARRRATRE